MLKKWLVLFRLPNLPTAPGDALAGAAISIVCSNRGGDAITLAIASAIAALFLYMFGLAHNDIVGATSGEDKITAPHRPIVAGQISLPAAKIAMYMCLLIAVLIGKFASLNFYWWMCVALLVCTIIIYNNYKNKFKLAGLFLMGLCRGLSLLSGAIATLSVATPSTTFTQIIPVPAIIISLGWVTYISAVTYLASDEHEASEGLGFYRYILGCSALIPLFSIPYIPETIQAAIVSACCVFVFINWCVAVSPLCHKHNPDIRRRVIGLLISFLLYLQAGFSLIYPTPSFIAIIALCFLSSVLIKKFAPRILGS